MIVCGIQHLQEETDSPGSVIASMHTRCNFPQAVPRSTLSAQPHKTLNMPSNRLRDCDTKAAQQICICIVEFQRAASKHSVSETLGRAHPTGDELQQAWDMKGCSHGCSDVKRRQKESRVLEVDPLGHIKICRLQCMTGALIVRSSRFQASWMAVSYIIFCCKDKSSQNSLQAA